MDVELRIYNIFDQGSVGHHFYAVLAGRSRSCTPLTRGGECIRLHQPGDFTGELDLLSGDQA